jgi:hypothetical protein
LGRLAAAAAAAADAVAALRDGVEPLLLQRRVWRRLAAAEG